MGSSVKDVQSKEELDELISHGEPVIVHFWASWCAASKPMDKVFFHLSIDFPDAHFLRVEAEEQPEISEAYSVSAVPYCVFLKDGKVVDKLEGANPSILANKVAKLTEFIIPGYTAAPASLGMAAGPAVLETVKDIGNNNSSSQLTSEGLNKRLEKLINSHNVILFMKGNPLEPKCGFSSKVVEILKKEKVKYGIFDILSDEKVREGLKKYSNWPTYPQLYCKGEFIGGCDIITSMHESGELKEALSEQEETLDDRMKKLIGSSPVMLFMKGTPHSPRCGFSKKVVHALKEEGVIFGSFDILCDEEIREGLKVFSNWPTFPQLYYKGELIGGCDIIMELQNNGELKATLSE